MNVTSATALKSELKLFDASFLSNDDPRFLCLKY